MEGDVGGGGSGGREASGGMIAAEADATVDAAVSQR
jgi:hypothetical protein